MSDRFDAKSLDSTLATIIANQESANIAARLANANQEAALAKILAQVEKTNGRVTVLETWKAIITAKVAVISAVIAGAVSLLMWVEKILAGG